MTEQTIIKGEFVNFNTTLYAERTEAEKMTEFVIITKLYMKIASYKSNFALSNEVTELVPIAIAELLTSMESVEEQLHFALGLLKNYCIEISNDNNTRAKIVIRNISAIGKLNNNQLFESLIIAFNFKRGTDFCLKSMLPAIKTNFKDYESLMEQYLELACDEFEKSVLKLGFSRRKDD